MKDQSNNEQRGEMRSDIRHIKETMERIEKLLHEMNGKVDKNTENLAVLMDWRGQHENRHESLDKRIWALVSANGILTAIGTFFGVKNG